MSSIFRNAITAVSSRSLQQENKCMAYPTRQSQSHPTIYNTNPLFCHQTHFSIIKPTICLSIPLFVNPTTTILVITHHVGRRYPGHLKGSFRDMMPDEVVANINVFGMGGNSFRLNKSKCTLVVTQKRKRAKNGKTMDGEEQTNPHSLLHSIVF